MPELAVAGDWAVLEDPEEVDHIAKLMDGVDRVEEIFERLGDEGSDRREGIRSPVPLDPHTVLERSENPAERRLRDAGLLEEVRTSLTTFLQYSNHRDPMRRTGEELHVVERRWVGHGSSRDVPDYQWTWAI